MKSIRGSHNELTAAIYLQVSIVSQALIFVTRSRSWSFLERPGLFLMVAFLIAQLVSFCEREYINEFGLLIYYIYICMYMLVLCVYNQLLSTGISF